MIFEKVAIDWFETMRSKFALKTQDMYLQILKHHINKEIGKMDLCDIKARHILVIIRNLEDQNKTRTAAKVKELITRIFNYSIINEYCENNPALPLRAVMKPHIVKNHPSLQQNELTEFFHAINKKGRLTPQGKRAFLLIALSALRANECVAAKWDEITRDDESIYLVDLESISPANSYTDRGAIKAWIKTVIYNDLTKDGMTVNDYKMQLLQINCQNKTIGLISSTSYKNGKVYGQSYRPTIPQIIDVIPDSIGDATLFAACYAWDNK